MPRMQKAAAVAGRGCFCEASRAAYLATRNWLKLVPIWVNTVMIWLADVSRKNLSDEFAQPCSNVEVGSPPVFTWIA